jgi:HPt (histidine-containing phosphotransfer) domain-containing protein
LRDLAGELSPIAVQEYLRTFLTHATGRLEELKSLIKSGEIDRVAYLSHDLVSTAGNLGALQMSVAARALARSCRNDDRKRASHFLDELAVSTFASCLEIQKWLLRSDAHPAAYRGLERRRTIKKVPKELRKAS